MCNSLFLYNLNSFTPGFASRLFCPLPNTLPIVPVNGELTTDTNDLNATSHGRNCEINNYLYEVKTNIIIFVKSKLIIVCCSREHKKNERKKKKS